MKQKLILGTALLTFSGIICRLIGFLYRIFLTHAIGAEGMGIYQLIVPVYHLSYAICTAGIQTALSRLVAAATAKKEYNKAIFTFFTGTLLSFLMSLCLCFFIQANSVYLSNHILGDSRCIPLLKVLSLALPFGALHGCLIGWFMGRKQVHIPAGMQILEELIRLGSTYLTYIYLLNHQELPTAKIAVYGLLFSEIVSVFLSFLIIAIRKNTAAIIPKIHSIFEISKSLLITSFPLTVNRITLNLLHSIEAILIPRALQHFGMNRTTALETLGTVTGMSLPLVLFPTAIINSLSSVLLPTVSENQALKNKRNIQRLIRKTGFYAGTIGIVCIIFFSLFGKQLGESLYHSTQSGHYIIILSLISPFLYINIILASVMNGLGKTLLCFSVNFINMCLRITSIYFLIPLIGIYGYLIGLIGGEIICTLLSILIIYFLIFSKPSKDSPKETIDK